MTMYKQILISADPQEKRVAVLEGASLEEFYVERTDEPKVAGNIYKGHGERYTARYGGGIRSSWPEKGRFSSCERRRRQASRNWKSYFPIPLMKRARRLRDSPGARCRR